ncbi:MAG TPA: hypothetical protein VK157_08825 [Phycisphaerales bacterium]|nr:hypothetical protein [Phycisphaerales bacterium]
MRASRRAFSVVEVIVLAIVLVLVIAIAFAFSQRTRRTTQRPMKDSAQIRGIHQGMVLLAQSAPDQYVIPSWVDTSHTTLTPESAKDDLGNILSVYLFNGFFSTELTVSPSEQSPLIQVYTNYALSRPPAAVQTPPDNNPGNNALWDPSFRGSPAEQVTRNGTKPVGTLAPEANVIAHNSYAMMPYFGARRAKWSNTFQANEAVIGNRGPMYEMVGSGAAAKSRLLDTGTNTSQAGFVSQTGKGTNSMTLGIHGDKKTWEGYIAYNDNHVNFETRADPENNPWRFSGLSLAEGRQRPDNLFLSEDDDTVTPMPAQIGTMSVPMQATSGGDANGAATPGGATSVRNALSMSNNWLRTWTVESVNEKAETSGVTVVVD